MLHPNTAKPVKVGGRVYLACINPDQGCPWQYFKEKACLKIKGACYIEVKNGSKASQSQG
jgi:hypothetical protein